MCCMRKLGNKERLKVSERSKGEENDYSEDEKNISGRTLWNGTKG